MKKIFILTIGFLLIGINLYAGDLIVEGNVGIGTASPELKLTLDNDGGIIAKGTFDSGATLTTASEGSNLIWYPRKAAFRVGYTFWDEANTGNFSTAMGLLTSAAGEGSTAIGNEAYAAGNSSTAMGRHTYAGGYGSLASGSYSLAYGDGAVAIGNNARADGFASAAIGSEVNAWANYSIVLGQGLGCLAPLDNDTPSSLMVGFNSDIPTFFVGPSAGVGTTGNVGIATTAPVEKLEVAGAVKIANTDSLCDSAHEGTIKYVNHHFYGCDGTDWKLLDNL